MDVVHTKTTLNAETIVISRAITTFNADDLFILNVISDLTTDATERANRIDFAIHCL